MAAYIAWTLYEPDKAATLRVAWLYGAVLATASISALLAAWARPGSERRGRIMVAAGMVVWTLGDVIYEILVHNAVSVPSPSIADGLYLSLYPCVYVGLLVVLGSRATQPSLSVRLDGIVLGIGVASVYSLMIAPVTSNATGGLRSVITNMAYPIGDLLLVGFVVAMLATLNWQFDRFVVLFACGCALYCVSDTHYLLTHAAGTYQTGTLIGLGWPAGMLVWSLAIRQPETSRTPRQPGLSAMLFAPIVVTLTSIALFVTSSETPIPKHVIALAAAGLIAVLVRMTVTFREVAAVTEARRQALTDDLTGLPNRRYLTERIGAMLKSSGASPHSLLVVGLSHFREINDAFGHVVGDQLLVDVSRRIATVAKDSALCARLAESEFAVWVPFGVGSPTAIGYAENLLAAFSTPFNVENVNVTVTASVGIAQFPDHAVDEIDLVRFAHMAMLEAQRSNSGRGVCKTAGSDVAKARLVLAEELRAAVGSDQLICHYQPKIDVLTGQVSSAEALVRWQHPLHGLLSPGAFLPIARESALLGDISRRVLSVVVAQAAEWARRGAPLKTSVNLTVTDLLDARLVVYMQELLQRHLLPASSIVVEVTEETFMREPEQVRRSLFALHELGVGISIDDYGSGYSSLAYLRTIPADELKLDQLFVRGIASDGAARSIVAATAGLAHSLGLILVAEGVETLGESVAIAQLGCDMGQGYFYSRPLAAPKFEEWLSTANPKRYALLTGA
jgi:diguanylate cyclase (GGDEF)-like protein